MDSRLAALMEDFAASFGDADHVIITEVYAVREANVLNVTGRDLAASLIGPSSEYIPRLVSLAQMEYQLPRLTKMWSHLERQSGGRVKGMGEKQIEVDKRILRTQGPGPDSRIVYIAGAFDLFHAGHVEMLKLARGLGDFLLVGIHPDQTVSANRGAHRPIMNLHERSLSVLACRYVDEVIIGAPWEVSKDMITTFNISLVVHGTIAENSEFLKGKINPYAVPMEVGIYRQLFSPLDITTTTIIKRIVANHEAYQILSMHKQWNGFEGEGEAKTRHRVETFYIRRRCILQSGDDFEVFMSGSMNHCRTSDYQIEGFFQRRQCKIRDRTGKVAAEICRKRVNTTILLSEDVFSLTVQPEFDCRLMVAFIVIMDRICQKPFTIPLCC